MISYSHEDRHFVAQLAAALKARKYEVWFDDGLRNSEEFSARIHSKIVDARAVVVVWSNKARESQWVRAEAQQAFNLKKPLIQVIKEPSSPQVPFPFDIFHYTDLSDWNFDSSAGQIEEIVAAIELPREPSQPSTAPSPAPVPQEIARFLDNKAKIRVIDRIAVGDLFEVYRGEYGKRLLAIKAVRAAIPTRVKQELLAEVALASNLNHPSFLRISDVLLDDNACFIIVDYIHGGAASRWDLLVFMAQMAAQRLPTDQDSYSSHAAPPAGIRIASRKRAAVRLSIIDFKRSISLRIGPLRNSSSALDKSACACWKSAPRFSLSARCCAFFCST